MPLLIEADLQNSSLCPYCITLECLPVRAASRSRHEDPLPLFGTAKDGLPAVPLPHRTSLFVRHRISRAELAATDQRGHPVNAVGPDSAGIARGRSQNSMSTYGTPSSIRRLRSSMKLAHHLSRWLRSMLRWMTMYKSISRCFRKYGICCNHCLSRVFSRS